MTRAELIHQMALMTDEELENCIQIYKDGGTTKQLDDYVSRLPDDQKEQEAKNIQNYLKYQKKSKRSIDELVTEAEQKNPRFIQRLNEEPKMVEFQSEEGKTEKGSHYLSWVTTDNGAIVFPTIMEDELGNLKYYGDSALDEALKRGDYLEMTPEEADLFTRNYKTTKYKPWFDEWEQLYGPDTYIKEVKKHAEGGPLDQSNSNTQYDLSKLFNAINTVSGGDKDATKRKYDNYDSFVQLYNSIIKPVYNYLRNKGFTSQQSAGIMGNILQESKFDTYNNGKGLTNMVSDKLNNYKKVYPEGGWQNHLNYVWDWAQGNLYQDKTVNHNYKSKNYREADHSTPQSSAAAFHDFFERPASSTSLPLRKGWADVFYRWFNDPIGFYKEGGELEFTNLQDLANQLNVEAEPEYKQVKLCREGSILDQLKQQLPDSEIFDLMKNFGIDELLEGGLKKGSTISVQIVLEDLKEDSNKPSKELKDIEIGDKSYKVEVVSSEEDMEKGLGNRKSLDEDKGMLFDFGEVQEEVTFNCEEMQFPIDIIFINDEDEVIRVAENCQPGKDLFTESNVRYVLEVNTNSGITKEDELDLDPQTKEPVMKVLAPDGSTQMELQGGERIFSRIKTRQLIKWAKRAEKTKKDSDYKHLGNIMFKEIKAQDSRPAEYVEVPE